MCSYDNHQRSRSSHRQNNDLKSHKIIISKMKTEFCTLYSVSAQDHCTHGLFRSLMVYGWFHILYSEYIWVHFLVYVYYRTRVCIYPVELISGVLHKVFIGRQSQRPSISQAQGKDHFAETKRRPLAPKSFLISSLRGTRKCQYTKLGLFLKIPFDDDDG